MKGNDRSIRASAPTRIGFLDRLLRRNPTTFIAGYDAIKPFDYPQPDLEEIWSRGQATIDELAPWMTPMPTSSIAWCTKSSISGGPRSTSTEPPG